MPHEFWACTIMNFGHAPNHPNTINTFQLLVHTNVGKKVTGKKVTEKKSQIWVGKKVTGKKSHKKELCFFSTFNEE